MAMVTLTSQMASLSGSKGETETIDKLPFRVQSGFTAELNNTDSSFLGFFGNFVKEDNFNKINRYESTYLQETSKATHSKVSQLK